MRGPMKPVPTTPALIVFMSGKGVSREMGKKFVDWVIRSPQIKCGRKRGVKTTKFFKKIADGSASGRPRLERIRNSCSVFSSV